MMRFFIFPIFIILIVVSLDINGLTADFSEKRVFIIEERIRLKNLSKDVRNLRIWVPYPVSDEWQSVDDFKSAGSFDAGFVTDKEYGNRIVYLVPKQKIQDEGASEIILSFKVQRKEGNTSKDLSTSGKTLARFLKSDRLVPVNGEIKNLAKKISQGKQNDLENVRAIYNYIIDVLTYSKDDPNICGIGDSLLTLKYKKGICTDYHSLFISLVRSLGIPAKFEIGFRIPEESNEGTLNGYHCWAKFYLNGEGWIPVDISEADKHPQKRDYFFGHIDENRIHLTTGRDIKLKYATDSQPLNFFVYPYIEVDGVEFVDMDVELSFREL